jgi:2-polyprenyl-3-methyl-5-hydroxy-6-metoxy-1,4-benzoquinol methylase
MTKSRFDSCAGNHGDVGVDRGKAPRAPFTIAPRKGAAHLPRHGRTRAEAMQDPQASRAHWEAVYANKRPHELSWFQPSLDVSLKLIRRTGIARNASILDVGAGSATLVDHLLDNGFTNVAVLDIARSGLEHAKARLAAKTTQVEWIVADVTDWRPPRLFDLWHDRAVFHFLTDPADQRSYARTLAAALKPNGWAIIAGFAPGGPQRCTGLDVVRHDAESLHDVFGSAFKVMEAHGETHVTPTGAEQAFRYHILACNS